MWTWSGGNQPVVTPWMRSTMCCDIIATPPKAFFHSGECTAATHSKVPTSCDCGNMKRRERTTGYSGQLPPFRCWKSRRGKIHWGKEHIRGLWVQDPDPYGWGETHTIPRPSTWGHTSTVSRVTPSPQTLCLGSHIHSLQGDPPHRPCTWGHTSTASRVTPLPRLCTWGGQTLG